MKSFDCADLTMLWWLTPTLKVMHFFQLPKWIGQFVLLSSDLDFHMLVYHSFMSTFRFDPYPMHGTLFLRKCCFDLDPFAHIFQIVKCFSIFNSSNLSYWSAALIPCMKAHLCNYCNANCPQSTSASGVQDHPMGSVSIHGGAGRYAGGSRRPVTAKCCAL